MNDSPAEPLIFPGHPLVIADQIITVFETPQDALSIVSGLDVECPAAVADDRIEGETSARYSACMLLTMAMNGTSAEALVHWADQQWIGSNAGGHPEAIEAGQAQADKVKPGLHEKLAEWINSV